MTPLTRSEYRRKLCGCWYRLPAIERIRDEISADKTLNAETREELLAIADRRVDEIVDARLDPRE